VELHATVKLYQCPVCGYPDLDEPPENDAICPSCGTHFGYDDATPKAEDVENIWRSLRHSWGSLGRPWMSHAEDPPRDWDPIRQLWNIGVFVPNERKDTVIVLGSGSMTASGAASPVFISDTAFIPVDMGNPRA
jgi:hypothetical protein